MLKTNKLVMMFTLALLGALPSQSFAQDISESSFEVVGFAPSVFSIGASATSSIMDFQRNVSVSNQLVGLIRIIHNKGIQTLTMESEGSGANGYPVNAASAEPAGLSSMEFRVGDTDTTGSGNACAILTGPVITGLDATALKTAPVALGTVDPLVLSGDHVCPIYATYATSATLSDPDTYKMTLKFVLTSTENGWRSSG